MSEEDFEEEKMEEKGVMVWLKVAEDDYNTAKYLFDGGIFYASAFYCQQSIEKALKYLLINEGGELVKTHSLKSLSKRVDMDENLQDKVVELDDIDRLSRYPVMVGDMNVEKYDKEDVENFLNIVKEVLEWIKNKMK